MCKSFALEMKCMMMFILYMQMICVFFLFIGNRLNLLVVSHSEA